LLKNGKDPGAIDRQKKDDWKKAPTVAELVDEYITRHAKCFKRSWKKDEAILNRDVIPAVGHRKAADVSKRDIILILEGITDRGAPGMANNCFQIIRKMFNYVYFNQI
jgi:hypothetical protein